jgi:dsRNA-specific ribonuclease
MFPNRNAIRYVEEGRSGPAHSPLFTIAVHVNGLVFHGIARTKQSARHEAAKQAIHCLTQHSLPQSQSLNTRSYYQRSQQLGVNRRPNPYGNYDRRTPFINRLQSNFTDYRHGLPHYESQPFPELQHEDDYRYDTEYRDNSDYDFYYYNRYNRDQWLGDRPLLYYREPRPMPPPTQIYYYPSPHRQPIVSQNQSLELYPQSVNTSPTDASALNSVNKSSDDFTVDDYNDDNFVEFKECSADKSDDSIEDNKSDEEQELIQKPLDKKERIILRVMSEKPVHQNPVSVIHELHPDAKWDCIGSELTSKKQSIIFKMKLQLPIADKSFIGTGRTKKLAKSDAASKALLNLYNISINLQNADNPESYAPKSTVQIAQEPLFLKQVFI